MPHVGHNYDPRALQQQDVVTVELGATIIMPEAAAQADESSTTDRDDEPDDW